jgi:hypothetical protein
MTRPGLAGGSSHSHAMMFSMAVDEKGRLDKDYLFFMDPNAGIVKIKNDPQSIEQFLTLLDTSLFGQMRLRGASLNTVTNPKLPEKDTEAWKELDKKILEGTNPIRELDYSLDKICRLDNYLQAQIGRLEVKSIWEKITGKVNSARVEKLTYLQGIRKELHESFNTIKENPEIDKASDQLFNKTMDKLATSSELQKKRGFTESTALSEFRKFKTRYNTELSTITESEPKSDPKPDEDKTEEQTLSNMP